MYPDEVDAIGSEAAGTVVETGPDVTGLAVGDRVLGMVPGGFGPLAVVDRRARGAGTGRLVLGPGRRPGRPAFATPPATALVDLRRGPGGDRVLVHAAAGGVGMAAAGGPAARGGGVRDGEPRQARGAAGMGPDEAHVASSRDTGFADRFPRMDVVLNSLAGEFVDASLRLLGPGGRFVELGKTDLRDPADLPGVDYRPFDLLRDAGPDRVQSLLTEVVAHAEAGEITGLPTRTWPLSDAREAFRFMARAQHTGKLVLTVAPYADGTVLITGAGVLGGLLARHLVAEHGARDLVLASRRGAAAPGSADLVAELAAAGATVRFETCDVTDPAALDAPARPAHRRKPADRRVAHRGRPRRRRAHRTTADRLPAVLRPKADAAWHLHERTAALDLSAFVLFSSAAATSAPRPGQLRRRQRLPRRARRPAPRRRTPRHRHGLGAVGRRHRPHPAPGRRRRRPLRPPAYRPHGRRRGTGPVRRGHPHRRGGDPHRPTRPPAPAAGPGPGAAAGPGRRPGRPGRRPPGVRRGGPGGADHRAARARARPRPARRRPRPGGRRPGAPGNRRGGGGGGGGRPTAASRSWASTR